ncbi:MAG: molybdopterin molybdenumtransferase MoeA, partial [Clostridiales bacterium]|nr:molybdopterin molybdenumtransferase MoeA [Clostridiales bacterium]
MPKEKKGLRISREEARKMLFALACPTSSEAVAVDCCNGRVLAEDFISNEMVPPFSKAPLDGYALRGEDTAGASSDAPVVLRITEEIAAGSAPQKPVLGGQAAKILTGAPIPEGANAVVRFEETHFTDETVTLTSPVMPNTNIVPAGDDIGLGRLIAKKGEVIT